MEAHLLLDIRCDPSRPRNIKHYPPLNAAAESGSKSEQLQMTEVQGSPNTHDNKDSGAPPSTSFYCIKLNATTFLVIEDDMYGEQPYMYVKVSPNLIFISDTGCNSPLQKNKTVTSLRDYLETYPSPANNDSALNPNGLRPYLILCTHCHYDHILGIPSFLASPTANPVILASSHCKSFILTNLPTHSLCKYLHISTPSYSISHWARHLEYLSYTCPIQGTSHPLRIQVLHIPGHTPDSLAWYDIDAHHLYIGDAFYTRRRSPDFPSPPSLVAPADAPIIFPLEGNLISYLSSLSLLLSFIQHQNFVLERQWAAEPIDRRPPENRSPPRVLLGSGHVTAAGDAETMTLEVRILFRGIVEGTVPVTRSEERRGEVFDYWCEGEMAKYSVLAPMTLVEEARRHLGGNFG